SCVSGGSVVTGGTGSVRSGGSVLPGVLPPTFGALPGRRFSSGSGSRGRVLAGGVAGAVVSVIRGGSGGRTAAAAFDGASFGGSGTFTLTGAGSAAGRPGFGSG